MARRGSVPWILGVDAVREGSVPQGRRAPQVRERMLPVPYQRRDGHRGRVRPALQEIPDKVAAEEVVTTSQVAPEAEVAGSCCIWLYSLRDGWVTARSDAAGIEFLEPTCSHAASDSGSSKGKKAAKKDKSFMAFLLERRDRAISLLRYGTHLSHGLTELVHQLAGPDEVARAQRLADPDYPYAD